MEEQNPIVALLLVSFHHERGNEIEYIYPPGNEIISNSDFLKDVIFLAMPDQAHHQDQDYIYFSLDRYHCVSCYHQIALKDVKDKTDDMTRASVQKSVCVVSRYAYFGTIRDIVEPATIAYFSSGMLQDKSNLEQCYRNLVSKFRLLPTLQEFCTFAESERLLFEASAEEQAAILASPQPILKKTKDLPATDFEKKAGSTPAGSPSAASDTSLVSSTNSDLSDVPLPMSPVETRNSDAPVVSQTPIGFSDLLGGVRLKWFLQKFGRNAMLLFKMLFLEVRVGFYAQQVSDVCDSVLGLTSLMPLLLEKFCCPPEEAVSAEFAYKKILNRQRRHSAAPPPMAAIPTPKVELKPKPTSELEAISEDDIDDGFVRIEDHRDDAARIRDEEKRRAKEQQDREITEIQQQFLAQALPLRVLQNSFYSPYICLQQVDSLNRVPSFLIGTSNALFVHNTDLLPMDCFVNMTNGEIQFRNEEIEQAMQLTMEDRVFIDYILETQQDHEKVQESQAVGSDQWVRSMFYDYTLSLLCAIVDCDFQSSRIPEFNSSWTRMWSKTSHFKVLRSFVEASMLPPGGGTPKKLHPALRLQTDSLMQKGLVALAAVNKRINEIQHTEFVKSVNTSLSSLTERVNNLILQTTSTSAVGGSRAGLTSSRRGVDDNDLADSNSIIDLGTSGIEDPWLNEDDSFDDDDDDEELKAPNGDSSIVKLPKNKIIIDPEAYARNRLNPPRDETDSEPSTPEKPAKPQPAAAKAPQAQQQQKQQDQPQSSFASRLGGWFSSVKASVEQKLKELDEAPIQPIPSRVPPAKK